VASFDWSAAKVAWAWVTVAVNVVGSRVARVWPTVTVWPALTSTAVTRPATAKERLAWLDGSMVPLADTAWVIVPVVTVWTLVVAAEAVEGRVAIQMPTPAPTTTTATTVSTNQCLVSRWLPLDRTGPSSWSSPTRPGRRATSTGARWRTSPPRRPAFEATHLGADLESPWRFL